MGGLKFCALFLTKFFKVNVTATGLVHKRTPNLAKWLSVHL